MVSAGRACAAYYIYRRYLITDEERIPIREDVKGACEILGIDPLYVANEGKLSACGCSTERSLAEMTYRRIR